MEGGLKKQFDRAVELWWKYERHVIVLGLAFGFVFDLIIADRPDSVFNNIWLLSYLVIAAGLIIVLNMREMRMAEAAHEAHPLFLLFALQVCFGALSSNLLVLYLQSGTFAGSAIFLGMLAALVVGNEFLRTRYGQLRFNLAVYYFLLLAYCVMAVPTFVLHSIGTFQFLISGAVSIGVIVLLLLALRATGTRAERKQSLGEPLGIVLGVFLAYAVLYFMNVIPPVPLSLKQIGVYHSVLPRAGEYVLVYEEPSWWRFWDATSRTFTLPASRTAFCFSSIFAPTQLTASVTHRWERYDEAAGRWESRAPITFPISGGRDQGYRGYSQASGLEAGRWRCNVETASGALIGRFSFTIVAGGEPELFQTTL